jgi:DNA polymerase (family 10)
LDELEAAARAHEVQELEGLGEKTEQKILDDLESARDQDERIRLNVARQLAAPLVAYLREIEGVSQVRVAGSYRRWKETVGDLDILVTTEDRSFVEHGARIIDRFVQYEDIERVLSRGDTKSTVVLRHGLQVDLRVVRERSYGAALFYFTGSKAHNIALRNLALQRDLKINEYGVFRGQERIAGETEQEIYDLFDLPYIVPELREHRGEIKAAQEDRLPALLTLEDLRGDLQTHTQASDGRNTLLEMAQAAQSRNYEYIAITDHSSRVGVTQGLDADALTQRIDDVDQVNQELDGIQILKSIEVDILEDGSLDMPDDLLSRLDVVIFAVHVGLDLPREKQTERIVRAMDNPHVHILAHPTGRMLGKRDPYELDMERVIEAAVERGCFLEVNAHPARLDLNDVHCRMAKEMGLKLAISTDAHRTSELGYLRYGVGQARRGWLEAGDVINTRSWKDLKSLLQR